VPTKLERFNGSPSVSVLGEPDAVVLGKDGKKFIVEFKVWDALDELPMAMIPEMRELQDLNKGLHAETILARVRVFLSQSGSTLFEELLGGLSPASTWHPLRDGAFEFVAKPAQP
jgi:hypothetical protein